MSARQRWLVAFYAVVALAALAATWRQNLQLMAPGMGPLDPYAVFIEQAGANAAARSITVDIAFFLLAAAAFMIIEARRLGVRFVWAYILLGFFIAISVTFPLFMIARTSIAVCCAVSACCDTGVILLSIFIAGGKPEVMKRSEPFLATSARSRS